MNASEMIESKLEQLEDNAGNHTQPRLMRDFRLFLESLSFELEKEQARLALGLKRVNSFRAIEYRQVGVMERDHNLVPHPRYKEHEQF